jgi:hypothetical protein
LAVNHHPPHDCSVNIENSWEAQFMAMWYKADFNLTLHINDIFLNIQFWYTRFPELPFPWKQYEKVIWERDLFYQNQKVIHLSAFQIYSAVRHVSSICTAQWKHPTFLNIGIKETWSTLNLHPQAAKIHSDPTNMYRLKFCRKTLCLK